MRHYLDNIYHSAKCIDLLWHPLSWAPAEKGQNRATSTTANVYASHTTRLNTPALTWEQ